MATYESLIKIKGAVGDLVFYNLNGKNIVRKKSGFNKTAFKKSPTYEKVRQNSSEFGHCSKIGKVIRQALEKYIRSADDPLLYQKFARLMTAIKDLDSVSERGKRTISKGISTEEGKLLLKGFRFGNRPNFDDKTAVSLNLWDKTLHLGEQYSGADEVTIVSLKVDPEKYTAETFEDQIPLDRQEKVVFGKHFPDDETVLHFVVLKKDGQITNMGFV